MGGTVDIKDIFPPPGHVQRLRCSDCDGWLDLAYADFDETVSGARIAIKGLPVLRCSTCEKDYLPDRSRISIIRLHEQCVSKVSAGVTVTRRKLEDRYPFTDVPFQYDADDYEYLPGLRGQGDGFLTLVFFKRGVLLKYDTASGYRLTFASRTYGTITTDEDNQISFGINRNGRVVMWLGDIATLPVPEQYYLLSENVESDHSIGSELYDGQIDCIFSDPTPENDLLAARTDFLEAARMHFGATLAHLEAEVVAIALDFARPLTDSVKNQQHAADALNKIHVESLDTQAIGKLLSAAGGDPKGLGGLKRLQTLLETLPGSSAISNLMLPLFVTYDLRVANLHLTSTGTASDKMDDITSRLGLPAAAPFFDVYDALVKQLAAAYRGLQELLTP